MPHLDQHPPGDFCWIELGTNNQPDAKRFYQTLFGWTANDIPVGPDEIYSMFQLEGRDVAAAYTLRPQQQAQGVPPHWLLYISVVNADETAGRATGLGGQVLAPPFDVFDIGRMAVLKDPTGAVFAIWQPLKHQGTGIAGANGALCWADLLTLDRGRASAFYSALFGWTISTAPNDPSGYLHIANGEQFIGGMPDIAQMQPDAPSAWLLYIATDDCDASVRKAEELGGSLCLPAMDIENVGRFAIVGDPQGANFALFQWQPQPK